MQTTEVTRDPSWQRIVLVLLCTLLPAFTLLHISKFIIDDAYISFRYAWNLAHGNGLTFNVGERTEGYSNLLWTLLMAASYEIGVPITLFAFAFGALFAALALLLSVLTARALGARFWIAALLCCVLGLYPYFWFTSTFGLEGGMASFGLAVFLLFGATQKEFWVAIFGAVLFCIRPELLASYPIYVASRLACELPSGLRGTLRRLAGPIGVWLAIILCITAWRYNYYGDVLPNTLRAKSVDLNWNIQSENFQLGMTYIFEFLLSVPILSLGFFAAILVGAIRRQPIVLTGGLLVLFEFFVVIVNGGDWMPGYRLLTIVSPILLIVSAWIMETWLGKRSDIRRTRWMASVYAICALLSVILSLANPGWGGWVPAVTTDLDTSNGCYGPVVNRLQSVLGPTDKIALDALGFAGYKLIHIYAYDLWGLTDRYTALTGSYGRHLGRFNPHHDYFDVRPNVILIHGSTWNFHLLQGGSNGAFKSTYDSYGFMGIPTCDPGHFFMAF